jgi:uncharacterized membrane protein YkvA (DUF1232 family)
MTNDKSPPGFKSAYQKASKIVNDAQKATRLVNAARAKANQRKNRIVQMKEDLENLFRMVLAWSKGEYRRVPIKTIVFAASAIVYFLNPFDLVHDYVPGAGYIDDATILAFVLNSISDDIREFLIWEKHS